MISERIERDGEAYVEVAESPTPLQTVQDAVDLIALCWEHGAKRLLLHSGVLAEDFFRLGTGVAGAMMQKWITYGVRTAVVASAEQTNRGKFKEMAAEARHSPHFRVFETKEEAEAWLLES